MEPQLLRCGNIESQHNARTADMTFNGATTFALWKQNHLALISAAHWPFNGATTFALWKQHDTTAPCQIIKAFNGATTFALWKPRMWCRGRICPMTFNGATTFALWKLVHCAWRNIVCLPSMEPQLLRCGNLFPSNGRPFGISLQWSHNFCVVETPR